jgi:hypothetical protein
MNTLYICMQRNIFIVSRVNENPDSLSVVSQPIFQLLLLLVIERQER